MEGLCFLTLFELCVPLFAESSCRVLSNWGVLRSIEALWYRGRYASATTAAL